MSKWYVLRTETGQEITVRDALHKIGISAIVPREIIHERSGGKWREKEKVLFTGYVFLKLPAKLDAQTYYKAKAIPKALGFCCVGREPTPIEPQEVDYIVAMTPNDDPLGLSDILIEEDVVRVVSGALLGFDGRILSVDKRRARAKVVFNLFGDKQTTIDVSVNILKPEAPDSAGEQE